MTAEQTKPAPAASPPGAAARWLNLALVAVVLAALGFVAASASRGVGGAVRIANPAVKGAPRPARPVFRSPTSLPVLFG